MLDGLAFLPLDMVHNGLAYVKDNAPHFIDYFDSTCHMSSLFLKDCALGLRVILDSSAQVTTRSRQLGPGQRQSCSRQPQTLLRYDYETAPPANETAPPNDK
ncbi:hypothetical protein LSH36_1141g00027 [Paralvinella palmiformis]|uniref:Uncharacterized protein n=1 Tax=Paralvinella palmiformis TaxID=53620 RepID=A0AAD9IV97_9ANNE|nr:hypothetical protein LSH36_1141g00027 [Paralvinella palmiformis]